MTVLLLTLVVTGPIFFKYTFWRDDRGRACLHLRPWAKSNAFKFYDFAVSEIAVSIIPMPLILLLNGAIIVKLRCLKAKGFIFVRWAAQVLYSDNSPFINCHSLWQDLVIPCFWDTQMLWHAGEECGLMYPKGQNWGYLGMPNRPFHIAPIWLWGSQLAPRTHLVAIARDVCTAPATYQLYQSWFSVSRLPFPALAPSWI